jgi:cell division protein FtsL
MCLVAVVVMFTQVGRLELVLFLGMLMSAVLIEIVARTQGRGFAMRRGAH